MPVTRRYIDGNARIQRLLAQRVNIVDFIGKVAEITPTLIRFTIPVVSELHQRRMLSLCLLKIVRSSQKNQCELPFLAFMAAVSISPSKSR